MLRFDSLLVRCVLCHRAVVHKFDQYLLQHALMLVRGNRRNTRAREERSTQGATARAAGQAAKALDGRLGVWVDARLCVLLRPGTLSMHIDCFSTILIHQHARSVLSASATSLQSAHQVLVRVHGVISMPEQLFASSACALSDSRFRPDCQADILARLLEALSAHLFTVSL